MSNPYLIISSDCHAGPETPDYREFLDPEFRDPFDKSLEERARLIAENKLASPISMGGDEDFQEEWFGHEEGEESLHEGGLRCGWDAPKRDKELDNDGVTAEVIFPGPDAATGSMGAPFGAGLVLHAEVPPDLMLAGAKAYNRWLAELCQHTPERRKGLAIAPILGNVDAAVEEIRRSHESGLTGGVMIPAMWGDYPSYAHDIYDPVWAVCEELHMPVHTHSGPGALHDYGAGAGVFGLYVSETRWWTARPMWFLLCSGKFEKYPGLKFATTEAGCFWAADLLWTMDEVFNRNHGARKTEHRFDLLKMLPERVLRPQHQDRFVEHAPPRARPSLRDRRRQHHVGQRLPAPRGHVAVHA